ncbi:hypothetical protein L4C33_15120 [Vibrio makurazakiensis]|uniref:hypothetical protein n=1 Tax=Vibrio makurazakiensis TaxID=2910250 RepID=UPI003D1416A7
MPILFSFTFDSMRQMEEGNQSAILAVIGLLMAAGIIGIFEATYQKTRLASRLQRTLAHLTKLLLFTGISELIILAVAAIGVTSTIWDDPLLWAILPIYASLYVYDWWDALIAADSSCTSSSSSSPSSEPKCNVKAELEPTELSDIQTQSETQTQNEVGAKPKPLSVSNPEPEPIAISHPKPKL